MSLNPTPYEGTTITTTATFTNPGVATPVDPSTVSVTFALQNHRSVTWNYMGSGLIIRVSQGVYSAELDTTGLPGQWIVQWAGTGACAATWVTTFPVNALPL